jgi:hypothetical protein
MSIFCNTDHSLVKSLAVITGLSISVLAVSAKADTVNPPPPKPTVTLNCEESHHHMANNLLILNNDGPTQQVYILTNISNTPLLLSHPQTDPGAGAGWASDLKPGYWSAIAMNLEKFTLSCQPNVAGAAPLDCAKVLNVCDMPEASFPRLNLGAYWVVENQPMSTSMAEIKKVGILLPTDNVPNSAANKVSNSTQ